MRVKESKSYRKRLSLIAVLTALAAAVIIGRLFQIQVALHKRYSETAQKQHQSRIKVELPRGRIFDRRGEIIALDIPTSYSFGVYPGEIADKYALAKAVAEYSGNSPSYFLRKMNNASGFIYLARQLDERGAKPYRKIPGLVEKCEPRRLYPFGANTPKIVGFTDPDGKGISGIEQLYNDQLASVPGWEIVLSDALGRKLKNPSNSRMEPIPGSDLILTFDHVIQELAHCELKAGVKKWGAKGGMAVVMLPRTGEVLSLVSLPGFDPNYPAKYGKRSLRERVVVDMYEPGSTFKIVPALAALKDGTPVSQVFDCENGRLRVGRHTIEDVKPHKWLTFKEVIAKSSNIGVVKISRAAGADKVYETARDLGFGNYTGIEMPGEAKGLLHPTVEWDKYMLSTVGIGQGVSVTALQLACAYGAVANDGLLLEPMVVKALRRPYGEVICAKPRAVRRVVSRKIAAQLTDILVQAVENGTGGNAVIPGLRIAGKTGTAQVPVSKEEGYSKDRYISSFIGYTVDEPRILCLVVIEEPSSGAYGGTVAAPIFKNIIMKTAPIVAAEQCEILGPSKLAALTGESGRGVPNLISYTVNEARNKLERDKIPYLLLGEGGKITSQLPYPGEAFTPGDTVIILAERAAKNPNPAGLCAREAAKRLISAGYEVKIVGRGVVRSAKFEGKRCTIYCQTKPSLH